MTKEKRNIMKKKRKKQSGSYRTANFQFAENVFFASRMLVVRVDSGFCRLCCEKTWNFLLMKKSGGISLRYVVLYKKRYDYLMIMSFLIDW